MKINFTEIADEMQLFFIFIWPILGFLIGLFTAGINGAILCLIIGFVFSALIVEYIPPILIVMITSVAILTGVISLIIILWRWLA